MPDYRQLARQIARRHGVPEGLFLAQINQESGFNPNAVSPAGAIGIAQIVPRWHPNANPRDPVAALNYAAAHMARLHAKYGNWNDPLSVYNSGRPWAQGQRIGETSRYVTNILRQAGSLTPAAGAVGAGMPGRASIGGALGRVPRGASVGNALAGLSPGGLGAGLAAALRMPSLPGAPSPSPTAPSLAPGPQGPAPIPPPQVPSARLEPGASGNLMERIMAWAQAEDQRLAEGKPSDERGFTQIVDLLSRMRPLQTNAPQVAPGGAVAMPRPVAGDKQPGSGPARTQGQFVMPLGRRGTRLGSPHQGTHTLGNWQSDRAIDIGVPAGTPVYAIFGGTVGSRIGPLNSANPRMAGLRLTIDGDADSAYYAHLSRLAVRAGDRVQPGQLIGYSGTANGVPHLHMGLRTGDPTRYFG